MRLIGGLALQRAATNEPIQDRWARQPRGVESTEEVEHRLRKGGRG